MQLHASFSLARTLSISNTIQISIPMGSNTRVMFNLRLNVNFMSEILEKDDPNDLLPVKAASLFYKACTNTGG